MKKLLSALVILLSGGSSLAQTFACQPTRFAGFADSEGKGWQVTKFILPKPFFLKVENGLITRDSAAAATRNTFTPGFTCGQFKANASSNSSDRITVLTCNDVASFLSWSPETGVGTIAATYGGFQPETVSGKDDVSLMMFTCQKM